MENEIRIRAFRATDDYETCQRFCEGHKKVLENHGIHSVSSSYNDWAFRSSVFVVVVESLDRKRLFGGARIHVADGINTLPIEEATWSMDPKISSVVNRYAYNGTGELCGLWNSVEVAGYGIGSIFSIRAATVIAQQIGIESLLFLCSPVTLRFNKWIGSKVITEIGNNGTFYYPKLDLLATAVIHEDAIDLKNAHPTERNRIMTLRKDLSGVKNETSPFKNLMMNVHYDLQLSGVDEKEFKQITYKDLNLQAV